MERLGRSKQSCQCEYLFQVRHNLKSQAVYSTSQSFEEQIGYFKFVSPGLPTSHPLLCRVTGQNGHDTWGQ